MRKWMLGCCCLLLLPLAGCFNGDERGQEPAGSASVLPSPAASPSPSESPTTKPDVTSGSAASPKATAQASPAVVTAKPTASVKPTAGPATAGALPPAQAKQVIEARTAQVIAALKAKNMTALQSFAHPDKGIRFSPYCYVDTKKDLSFKPVQLAKLLEDKTVRIWGSYDGSGEPISLTFAHYYDKFIYDHDFVKPEKTGYNETLSRSNTKNNIRQAYPDAIIVEYHFSGFDAKLEGHDWSSLNLVYEEKAGTWYLVGVVHSQWTI